MTIIRCVLLLVAQVAWNASAASAQNTAPGMGPRHLESIQKLREIVRANLPEFRSMVK